MTADSRWLALLSLNITFLCIKKAFHAPWRTFLTCDLGFDLALHLQGVDEDAAVADEAGAGYSSVRLAETLFIKIVTETTEYKEI